MKKILSLLVAMVMALSCVGITAMAVEGKVVNTEADLKAALETGGEAKLGGNIVINEMITVPQDTTVTLELNGYDITVKESTDRHIYAINNRGTLTLKDSVGTGSISARGIYNGYDGSDTDNTVDGAKMTIESGTYNAIDSNGGAAIFNCAELIINNGTFEGKTAAVNNRAKGKATINGGTYRSDSGAVHYAIQNNSGTMSINNATVDKGFGAVGIWGGSTIINDGNFLPTGAAGNTCHVVYVGGSSNVTINGGTFKMNYPADAVPDSGSAVASYDNGKVSISGGEFTAHFDNVSPVELSTGSEITGGKFMNHSGEASSHAYVTNFLKEGYTLGTDGKVTSSYIAKIGDVEYTDLQEAIDKATAGDTVTLLKNIEQTDGILITDAKITLDLNEKSFKVTEGNSTSSRNILINGASVVTIKNGTLIAGGDINSGAYGTVRTEGTAIVTLENLELYNYRGNGLNIKSLGGTNVKISNTNVYSQYGGGIEAAGATITLDNVNVYQKGMWTAPYNSMAISVNGGGKVTVNSGYYETIPLAAEDAYNQGSSHGSWAAGVLNSGGTLVINDGTFVNGNYGDDSLATAARGLILADTGANIQINGGTFNALKGIIDIQNNLGDAAKNPKGSIEGGIFSADPTNNYVTIAEGYEVSVNEDGTYSVESAGTLATENVLIQNMAQGTTATGDPTYRVGCFAAIDSANYSLLGIEVKADNGKVTGSGTTQYLYTYINVTNSKGEVTKILPETLGETNKYIFGRIMAFTTNYTDFSFRPFAVSLDGKTTFYGNWSKEYTVDPE